MKPLAWLGVSSLLAPLLALLVNGCAPMAQTTAAQPAAAAAALPRITIVYDAFGKGGTKQDWGYAALTCMRGSAPSSRPVLP